MPPLNGLSKSHRYRKVFSEPSAMLELFTNITLPSGRQTVSVNAKFATGFGNILNGMAVPATDGVSHSLKSVLPSLPTLRTI